MTNSNKNTNKSFLKALADSAIDGLTFSQEMFTKRSQENEKITETSSRRERLGESGMRAETHAKHDSYLSGLRANEMRIMKMVNPSLDAGNVVKSASREHKKYLIGLCSVIAQETSAPNMDALNEAAKKVNPKFSRITKVHSSVFAMMEAVNDNDKTFSAGYLKALKNDDTFTQAGYILGFFKKYNLGTVHGSGEGRYVEINNDHPLIQKMRELTSSKKVANPYS